MRHRLREDGFTLVEVLVAIGIFSAMSVGLYTVMFSGQRASDTTRNVVGISEEARLGINRMVRDTREADEIAEIYYDAAGNVVGFKVLVNFDNSFDGTGDPTYVSSGGNLEDPVFYYDQPTRGIYISDLGAPTGGELLASGVQPVDASTPIFSFYSHFLELDDNADGEVSCAELDAAASQGFMPAPGGQYPDEGEVGNASGTCDIGEWPFLSRVHFSLRIQLGARFENFYSHAQLRNCALSRLEESVVPRCPETPPAP